LKGADGRRPVLKYHPKLSGDRHFGDYVLFHEYFHGDTGRGVGVSSDGVDRTRCQAAATTHYGEEYAS